MQTFQDSKKLAIKPLEVEDEEEHTFSASVIGKPTKTSVEVQIDPSSEQHQWLSNYCQVFALTVTYIDPLECCCLFFKVSDGKIELLHFRYAKAAFRLML